MRSASVAENRLTASVLGMVLFIASEVMFFGALFGAYYTLRARAAEWPPPGSPETDLVRPLILTAILLSSSATQHFAVEAAGRKDGRALARWVWLTFSLGAVFLVGEALEWRALFDEGFVISSNVFGSLFFTITGFHGLHVAAGLAMLLLALKKTRIAPEGGQGVGALQAATFYWHFVDGVWIFVLLSLYVTNI